MTLLFVNSWNLYSFVNYPLCINHKNSPDQYAKKTPSIPDLMRLWKNILQFATIQEKQEKQERQERHKRQKRQPARKKRQERHKRQVR